MTGRTVQELQDASLVIGRRSAPRLRLSLPARLQTMYDTRPCILLDLSQTGAQIGLREPLKKGADVILLFKDIDQFGTVVRCAESQEGSINGINFETPLSKEDVLQIRRYTDYYEAHTIRDLKGEARAWVSGAKR